MTKSMRRLIFSWKAGQVLSLALRWRRPTPILPLHGSTQQSEHRRRDRMTHSAAVFPALTSRR